ncbi:MAG: DUF4412 domain-containing protein [Bacteroidota bacterium]|nr:DUF4412 domain-containing protein [Bacteroidota bacterium]
MKRFLIATLLLCSAAFTFAQGLYWQSTTDGVRTKHSEESYAVPKMFKMVRSTEAGEGSIMIARLDKQLIWNLNPEKKTYSEITFADLEKMAEKGAAKMDKMKEKMKGMPEEQRKMMEKMMGMQNDQPIEVKKTGETKSVAGYKCTKVTAVRGEEEVMTWWLTKDLTGFEPLMADWKEFSKRMSAMTARFAKGTSEIYKNINGFPMETTMKIMNSSITTTVTKVEKRSIPSSEFDVPAGYKKVKSEMEESMQKMDKEE